MCFTPIISLTTAIIEFIAATIILIFYKKSLMNKFWIVLIYLLGLYQFTEFMLCQTNNNLWIILGFITYTFLPALGLNMGIRMTNSKYIKYEKILYIMPVIFSILAIIYKENSIYSTCSTYFLTSKAVFLYNFENIPFIIYILYYFGFILLTLIILSNKLKEEKNKIKKQIYLTFLISILISLIPALILLIILPSWGIMFPSIYCEFAILFTIAALISVQLNKKLKN